MKIEIRKKPDCLDHTSLTPLEVLKVGKATAVKLTSEKEFIYMEKLKDGTWGLYWTEKTIPDFTLVDRIVFVRESEVEKNELYDRQLLSKVYASNFSYDLSLYCHWM